MLSVDIVTGQGGFRVSATFDAPEGVTVLRAPSGAGKSLVLQTIAGLIRPISGTVQIGGVIVAEVDANPRSGPGVHLRTQDRRIGMVFQHGALLPHRTPLDNVKLALRGIREGADLRHRAEHWLEVVGAQHLKGNSTRDLSGGEQQRISLARALAGEPQVLLLDEPFSALDHAARVQLRHTLKSVLDTKPIATIFVTHDADDIEAIADHVVDLVPGSARAQ
jgi:molybdate transport system ATP-binding protein